MEAKVRWFRSLTPEERLAMLEEWTSLVLENNPHLIGVKDANPVEGRVRVLELPAGYWRDCSSALRSSTRSSILTF